MQLHLRVGGVRMFFVMSCILGVGLSFNLFVMCVRVCWRAVGVLLAVHHGVVNRFGWWVGGWCCWVVIPAILLLLGFYHLLELMGGIGTVVLLSLCANGINSYGFYLFAGSCTGMGCGKT
jgi:hypothetical protein